MNEKKILFDHIEFLKRSLRADILAKRQRIDENERKEASEKICTKLIARFEKWLSTGNKLSRGKIAVYLSSAQEISLDKFIKRIARCREGENSTGIYAPKWDSIRKEYILEELSFEEALNPGAIALGHYSIREPKENEASLPSEEIDIWFIPALAFDAKGNRLGYGGGYYDRFLAKAKESSLKIGVALPFQIKENLPAKKHDIPVGEIVLP